MVTRAVGDALAELGPGTGPGAGRILVACSAGIDSTVLLDALQLLRCNIAVGHVNHGLRGDSSEADERFVRELARARGVPFVHARVDPAALRRDRSSRERPTLQEAARRLRYDALAQLAAEAGADWIATGHTADDQAETVLLRLLRGAGPDALAGIPRRNGALVRPLLGASRADVERHAAERALVWREDASNRSPAYTRNRIRRLIRQLEADFNPKLSRALGELAEAQRRDRAWVERLVAREAESRFSNLGGALVIEAKDWNALPDALALRLAREALRRSGAARDVTRVHLERVVKYLREGRTGTAIELPGGRELARRGGSFLLRAKLPKNL
jgi:tRNA(Ile)-lysidine synthase